MAAPKTIAVIDPAAGTPELDAFNALAQRSSALPVALTYHLPALFGLDSLAQLEARAQLAGVIVFGSAASVHDDAPWQRELNAWLLPRLQSDAGPPVLGLCYGHQLIAHLLGGEVGRVWPGAPLCLPARPPLGVRADLSPLLLRWAGGTKRTGVRRVLLPAEPELWGGARQGSLVVSHNEGVVKLPPGMRALCSVAEGGGEPTGVADPVAGCATALPCPEP